MKTTFNKTFTKIEEFIFYYFPILKFKSKYFATINIYSSNNTSFNKLDLIFKKGIKENKNLFYSIKKDRDSYHYIISVFMEIFNALNKEIKNNPPKCFYNKLFNILYINDWKIKINDKNEIIKSCGYDIIEVFKMAYDFYISSESLQSTLLENLSDRQPKQEKELLVFNKEKFVGIINPK